MARARVADQSGSREIPLDADMKRFPARAIRGESARGDRGTVDGFTHCDPAGVVEFLLRHNFTDDDTEAIAMRDVLTNQRVKRTVLTAREMSKRSRRASARTGQNGLESFQQTDPSLKVSTM